jgi:RNA polymerase sigma-54 factor
MVLRSRLGQQAAPRQTQRLGLAPAQQQSIRLLGMTNLELAELLAEAMAENPLLEPATDLPEQAQAQLRRAADRARRRPSAARALPKGLDRLFAARGRGASQNTGEGSMVADAGSSLAEHLATQLGADVARAEDRLIGQALIEAVDEAGYLTLEPAEIAERLRQDPRQVERILKRLQEFDPPGVFARSLAECLALQLADQGRLDGPMQRLLERLDLLAEGKREALARYCGVDRDQLDRMIATVRRLDPRPGLAFERSPIQTVTPDLTIARAADGSWEVELNADSLPRLVLNRDYPATGGAEARAYLKDQRRAAEWLLAALDRRCETLQRVASFIVRRQSGFLEHGIGALKPLSRREIAGSLDLHESTVSRAIAGKYAATPTGVVALATFFGGRLGDTMGAPLEAAGHAPAAARERLRQMIAGEPAALSLSDQELARRLSREGIQLSRRTVAKYREMLRIPPAYQRRRRASL